MVVGREYEPTAFEGPVACGRGGGVGGHWPRLGCFQGRRPALTYRPLPYDNPMTRGGVSSQRTGAA